MAFEQTRHAAYTMLEYCRLMETDHDGRGVRWRLMWMNREGNQNATEFPGWNWIGCDYSIEVRKPDTVFRVEYHGTATYELIASEHTTMDSAARASGDGTVGTITEIERPGEWVTWEPVETESNGHSEGRTLRDLVYEWGVVHHGFRNASDGVHGTIRDNILHAISVEVVREREKRAAEDRERREQQSSATDEVMKCAIAERTAFTEKIHKIEDDRDFWRRRHDQLASALQIVRGGLSESCRRDLAELCRKCAGPCFCGTHEGTETVADGLKRAVSEPGVCSWTYDATHDKHDTQCGHLFTFVEGFHREYGFAFCPYCGGRRVESKGD